MDARMPSASSICFSCCGVQRLVSVRIVTGAGAENACSSRSMRSRPDSFSQSMENCSFHIWIIHAGME